MIEEILQADIVDETDTLTDLTLAAIENLKRLRKKAPRCTKKCCLDNFSRDRTATK